VLSDSRVEDDERDELRALLEATVGTQAEPETNPTTTLPFDNPSPLLTFAEQTYLFTGEFVYGTRKDCQAAVVIRGGHCVSRVNHQVNVLVVGCIGSRDWAHTSFGRRIEDVVRLQRRGMRISIVPEEHWVMQLHQ
jgi:NAD-dependent DNA ligase